MNILAFDTETTGVTIEKDRPLQIALVQHGPTPRILFNSYCNPLMEVEKEAVEVHKITPDKYQFAPDFVAASWLAAEAVSKVKHPENNIVVTYNGTVFDLPLIEKCLGYDMFVDYWKLDLFSVAMRYFPNENSFKLPNLYQSMLGKEAPSAHDAASDCINLLQLLDKMCIKLGKTPLSLAQDMETARPLTIMPFSKNHKGKLMSEVPKGFAKWLLDQNIGKIMHPDLRLSMEMIVSGEIHNQYKQAA